MSTYRTNGKTIQDVATVQPVDSMEEDRAKVFVDPPAPRSLDSPELWAGAKDRWGAGLTPP